MHMWLKNFQPFFLKVFFLNQTENPEVIGATSGNLVPEEEVGFCPETAVGETQYRYCLDQRPILDPFNLG